MADYQVVLDRNRVLGHLIELGERFVFYTAVADLEALDGRVFTSGNTALKQIRALMGARVAFADDLYNPVDVEAIQQRPAA